MIQRIYKSGRKWTRRMLWKWRDIRYVPLHSYQRAKRGWSDNDIINMDIYLASLLGAMLHTLAENSGYPATFAEIVGLQEETWNEKTWKSYLHELGNAFDIYYDLHSMGEIEEQGYREVYEWSLAKMPELFDQFESLWN